MKDFTFTWKIKDFSAKQKVKYALESPVFFMDDLEEVDWFLSLKPNFNTCSCSDFMEIFLNRKGKGDHIELVEIELIITITAIDISSKISKKLYCLFPPNSAFGLHNFVKLEEILSNKEWYLPQDILTVKCYMVLVNCDQKSVKTVETVEIKKVAKLRNATNSNTLSCDLQSMYINEILCDVELRIGDEIFPAHKLVLCARSPVFKAMFTNDTIEKRTGIVNITDMDSQTVEGFLSFMYLDSLDSLKLDIFKLYYAADKYQVSSLKAQCSFRLKSNLQLSNVCDILAFADLHQETDLMTSVHNFIFIHALEIFKSSEWDNFIEHNPKLAALAMKRACIEKFHN